MKIDHSLAIRPLSFAFAVSLTLTAPTSAQCLMPDNLDTGACCTPVDISLPSFPPIGLSALSVTWDACSVNTQDCTSVSIGSPNPTPNCGTLLAPISIDDCAGVAQLSGTLQLDYSRTWDEIEPVVGTSYQVWRFMAKVDFSTGFATPPSNLPSCLGSFPTAFYYGYVDYALDCASGAFNSAIVLYHGCDDFQHKPGLSSQPGVFHPFDTYAIVAPHTAADPFTPSPLPPSGGTLLLDAMRNATSPLPDICLSEERIVQGVLAPLAQACLCPLSFFFPPQYTVSRLSGAGACGSGFTSLNVWPTVPWFELVTVAIGRWSSAAVYPGPESAAVAEGVFLYTDACASGASPNSVDIFYGSETNDGFTVLPFDPTLPGPQHFLDLASNYSVPFPGAISLPLVGSVAPTDHLLQVNAF